MTLSHCRPAQPCRSAAPSFVGPSYAREALRPITIDEIHELTRQFGDAAVRMQKIVIVGGGSVGCETADYLAPLVNDLAPSNRDVTLIEMTRTLADALTEAGFACHVLGDSKQCGNLRDAIEAGYKAACEL